jgi:hypothetical protein
MRFRLKPLRAVSSVTILGTALAAILMTTPAVASASGAGAGQSAPPGSSLPGAVQPAGFTSASGVITGIVDGQDRKPLTAACVLASGPAGNTLAVTHADGRYLLASLTAGRYVLRISSCANGAEDVRQPAGIPAATSTMTVLLADGQQRQLATVTLRASPLAVTPAAPALRSAAPAVLGLRPGRALAANGFVTASGKGSIAGRVTGDGRPLQGVCVTAYGAGYGQTHTLKEGHYRITKLRPGRYTVVFVPSSYCGKNSGNWLNQVYKGINGPELRGKPTRVRVSAGKATKGIDAALQLGGEISGVVRGQNGAAVSRVCVLAQGKIGKDSYETYAVSGKNGGYAIHSLYPGTYKVVFLPRFCGSAGNYIPQWWPGSATAKHAKAIIVKRGLIVRGIDAALRPGATLTGVVRAGGPHGALLGGICVYALPAGSQPFGTSAQADTAKDGSFRLTGLLTGKYHVYFNRGCRNQGNYLSAERTAAVVAGHVKKGFDVFMTIGGIISGTVTDAHGSPVRGICVGVSGGPSYGATRTGAGGKYTIVALGSGSYQLFFSGGCGNAGSYAPQYYRGQVNFASATPIKVSAGHTTAGIDVAMQPGGTITGLVTDSSGNRLNGICVEVQVPAVARYGFPFTIGGVRNGRYTATNLTPGVYVVNFSCPFGEGTYATQWFQGQPGEGTADYVSAPAGVITGGINAILRRGGLVTGTVTNSAGKAASGVCVQVMPHGSPSDGNLRFFGRTISFTNGRGTYRIGPVAAGKYDVQFGCFGSRYASEWYHASATRAGATPVTVANDVTTTGVNAALNTGGSITGEVTNSAGKPQPQICVSANDAADFSNGFAVTNKQGHYAIGRLGSGAYELIFSDCGFGRHHVRLGAVIEPSLAKVSEPHATTVNAKVVPAGSISGVVKGGAARTPQANVCVGVIPASGNTGSLDAITSRSGSYELSGLAPGSYKVYFGDNFCELSGSNYAPQWYQGKSSQAAAADVKVTSGGHTTGISATLGTGGAIAGTVISEFRKPVAGECVTATPVGAVPDPLFGTGPHPVVAVTQANGTYQVVGLQPGKYTAEFSAGCGTTGFRSQWWNDAGSAGKATVITVPPSGTVTGISAVLRRS